VNCALKCTFVLNERTASEIALLTGKNYGLYKSLSQKRGNSENLSLIFSMCRVIPMRPFPAQIPIPLVTLGFSPDWR
jgi:hypothetical protein